MDRAGTFEPLLLPKRERMLNSELDLNIIKLYGLGMSQRDISDHVRDLYDIEVSEATISAVTDVVIADVNAWRQRPLEARYAIVWLDAIHFKVKEEGRVVNKAVYTILGVGPDGHKDLLGLYVGQHEGAKFWLTVLHDLRQRGVEVKRWTVVGLVTCRTYRESWIGQCVDEKIIGVRGSLVQHRLRPCPPGGSQHIARRALTSNVHFRPRRGRSRCSHRNTRKSALVR